ncbi:MAG: hypothetical protein ACLPN5_16235 [Roseiarcus sp.]
MKTFSKLLIVVATAAATLGATNSAFAYIDYYSSSDDGYRSSHGSDRHGFNRGYEQFAFGGHDRRR